MFGPLLLYTVAVYLVRCVLRFLAVLVLILLAIVAYRVYAAELPRQAYQHRATLIREARAQFGMAAPVATFAAQLHQESRWRTDAVSPVGARGMAQVMPATARHLVQIDPSLAPNAPPVSEQPPSPHEPGMGWGIGYAGWDIRALVVYDRWLWTRVQAATPCERMAKVLAAYNGGLGWVQRDERLAASRGFDARRWWGHVDQVNAGRSAAAWRENRDYPRLILRAHEPRYIAAGFGAGSCA